MCLILFWKNKIKSYEYPDNPVVCTNLSFSTIFTIVKLTWPLSLVRFTTSITFLYIIDEKCEYIISLLESPYFSLIYFRWTYRGSEHQKFDGDLILPVKTLSEEKRNPIDNSTRFAKLHLMIWCEIATCVWITV